MPSFEDSVILFLKNLLFTILVPGTVAVLVPILIHRGELFVFHLRSVPAVVLMLGASVIYFWCLWDFAHFGRGTPAPIDAPKHLVVRGPYRYTRNPMYVAALLAILGWALYFADPLLVVYWLVVASGFQLFVVFYEEPHLSSLFGSEYSSYCATVNRWLPFIDKSRAENKRPE
jgi:protein-S-isoprenylcysteine O-methyltransferase Ste14